MKSVVTHRRSCFGAKAQPTQLFPLREPDADDFSVKDVFDCVPQATSKSVRHAFETSGYSMQRFVKMPDAHSTAYKFVARAQLRVPTRGKRDGAWPKSWTSLVSNQAGMTCWLTEWVMV